METFKTVVGILVLFLGLPLLIVWLNDRLFHRTLSKAEWEEYSERFRERLLKPDFAALEAHFDCAMPKELKDLYADKKEILRGGFEVLTDKSGAPEHSWPVAFYLPADLESLRDVWPDCKELFAFADDGCGNGYLIDPRKPDLEVLFHDHEDSQITRVGLNLAGFISAPRRTSED
jgi:hypothetical protein